MTRRPIRAECLKLWANRPTLFWGFCAAPLITLALGVMQALFIAAMLPQARSTMAPPLLNAAAEAMSAASHPVTQLFYALAAATIFAGEYRWETWRYLVPRAPRPQLMLAKMAIFMIFTIISLLLLALAGIASDVIGAIATRSRIILSVNPAQDLVIIGLSFIVALLHLAVVGALAALLSVATRSVIATLLIVFLIGLGQTMMMGLLFGQFYEDPRFIAALPALAAGTARRWIAFIAGNPAAATPYGALGFAMLAAWACGLLAAAIALFQRQPLSQE